MHGITSGSRRPVATSTPPIFKEGVAAEGEAGSHKVIYAKSGKPSAPGDNNGVMKKYLPGRVALFAFSLRLQKLSFLVNFVLLYIITEFSSSRRIHNTMSLHSSQPPKHAHCMTSGVCQLPSLPVHGSFSCVAERFNLDLGYACQISGILQ